MQLNAQDPAPKQAKVLVEAGLCLKHVKQFIAWLVCVFVYVLLCLSVCMLSIPSHISAY